jgi:hypothetical protein
MMTGTIKSTGSAWIGALAATVLLAACAGPMGEKSAPERYSVGGRVSGLSGTVVLQDNGGDDRTVFADGSFIFATTLPAGSAYAVSVRTQPAGQMCLVANGAGAVPNANVSAVAVTCTMTSYTIGGIITGVSGSVVLQDNGGNDLPVSANGAFTFTAPVASGGPYAVTVKTQPAGQACVVANGSGVVASANVTSVTVTCSANTFSIGGTATGLAGVGCVLQDNGGDNLSLSADGAFGFSTRVLTGASYRASILTQPTGPTQSCVITGGSGIVAGADVHTVAVNCSVVRPPCSLAPTLGTLSGDQGSGSFTASGAGEAWFRVHISEDNGLVPQYLSAQASLLMPPGVDYDLFVFCGACGGAMAGSSLNGVGQNERVLVRWEDRLGLDDGQDILIQVRYVSGKSASNWTLVIQGDVPVSTTTCFF